MRFESATVPAAVMPDRFNDDGFLNYLPLSAFWLMGRLQKIGISQKTCHTRLKFKAFGKKSAGSIVDSYLKFSRLLLMVNIRNDDDLIVLPYNRLRTNGSK